IDAWAVRYYGSIAGAQEHFQTSFVRWLLYFSPYVRVGEFLLGTLVAQLYISLERRSVSDRENLIGTVVFFTAVISVVVITYLNYSAIAYLTNGPNAAANMSCTNIVCKMNMNFALAPTAAVLIFLRSPLQKYWFARAGITPRASFGRCKLLYLSRPRCRAGNCREAHRIGKTLCCLRFGETRASSRSRSGDFAGSVYLL
ncbi:MAG TPA: hypothetical protein VFX32_00220, partial [Pseudolabrys sp.]|nr:hypothetical protein [Pseudolabrys sp.]